MHFYLIIHHIVILFSVCVYLWIVCGCSECDEKNKNKKYIEKGRKVEPYVRFCIFLLAAFYWKRAI